MHPFPIASRSIVIFSTRLRAGSVARPLSNGRPLTSWGHGVRNGDLGSSYVCVLLLGADEGARRLTAQGAGSKDPRQPRTEGHFAHPRPETACGAWARPLGELLCPWQCAAGHRVSNLLPSLAAPALGCVRKERSRSKFGKCLAFAFPVPFGGFLDLGMVVWSDHHHRGKEAKAPP